MIVKWKCTAPCTGKVVRFTVQTDDQGTFSSELGIPEPVRRGELYRCETYGSHVEQLVALMVENGTGHRFPVPMTAELQVAVAP